MVERFNIRVYFLLITDSSEVLVSDEIIKGEYYTKFPGGGMELGEGSLECAMREACEELGQEIAALHHYYTTDFFVRSAFHPADQVMAIYYTAKLKGEQQFRTTSKRFDFSQATSNEESFRWVKISELNADEFAFPTDKAVVHLLIG